LPSHKHMIAGRVCQFPKCADYRGNQDVDSAGFSGQPSPIHDGARDIGTPGFAREPPRPRRSPPDSLATGDPLREFERYTAAGDGDGPDRSLLPAGCGGVGVGGHFVLVAAPRRDNVDGTGARLAGTLTTHRP